MSSDTSALLRYGSLLALVAQDTALVLLLRSSREDKGDVPMYLASTAVFCMEIAKLSSCALMILKLCDWNIGRWARTVNNEVFEPWGVLKLSVPGVLYLVQVGVPLLLHKELYYCNDALSARYRKGMAA